MSQIATTLHHHARTASVRAVTWLQDTACALVTGVGRHWELYAIALLTHAAALLQSHWLGVPLVWNVAGMISLLTLMLFAVLILVRLLVELVRLWWTGHPGSATVALTHKLFGDMLSPDRVSNIVHAFIASGIFAAGFSIIKSNIPHAMPFAWDETFMQLDQALHFGVLPHELLMPLFRHPLSTFVMNLIYNAWFFILMGFFIWQGLCADDTPLRQRYLLAYMLNWLLGTLVLGTIFSSAGPCYFGRVVTGPDPYAGLMDHLRHANSYYPIWALSTQDMLWEKFASGKGAISGISAMPSMHVASSVMFFLCARAAGIRWLTWCCGIFAAAIVMGSVLLAWHYAVDSYVGVLLALACWKLAGWWVGRKRLSSRPS